MANPDPESQRVTASTVTLLYGEVLIYGEGPHSRERLRLARVVGASVLVRPEGFEPPTPRFEACVTKTPSRHLSSGLEELVLSPI